MNRGRDVLFKIERPTFKSTMCPMEAMCGSRRVRERNRDVSVRREKALVHSGDEGPPGNWIAPPGSNRSGGGGNEAAEASGVEGR